MVNSATTGDGAAGNSEATNAPDAAPAGEAAASTRRTPFTSLSQVDADRELARVLQEQERAYVMLQMNRGDGHRGDYWNYDYDGEENGEEYEEDEDDEEYGEEEDAGDVDYGEGAVGADDGDGDAEGDPAEYEDDEAFVHAMQEIEAFPGLDHGEEEEDDDLQGDESQDLMDEADPDEYCYEELIALGELAGVESKGLSADTISLLPTIHYVAENKQDGSTAQCVVCQMEYEDGESLVMLSCKHLYHPECISKWLERNKVCPICSAEVST